MKKAAMIFSLVMVCSSSVFAESLWNDSKGDLFSNRKARKVGDIVTVMISEQTSTNRKATKRTSKDSSVDGKVESWFTVSGIVGAFKNILSLGGAPEVKSQPAGTGNLPAWKFGTKHQFDGEGTLTRKDTVTARISCMVQEVQQNGYMKISGKQQLMVDGDRQDLSLTGIVREDDVRADNTVFSYNVADANIVFGGTGAVADKQKRGIVERIGDFLWPF
jgi:flagellar L-ring protein precursor FlgH